MDIKLLGIELELGKGITLIDFFQHIEQTKGNPIVLFKYGRFMYVKDLGADYAGLLITTKDQKKFLEFTHDALNAKLETRDVTEGAQLADFNFFLINKATKRGIYQYYHNSCSLNTFGMVCKKHYDELRSQKIQSGISGLSKTSLRQEKAIRDSYAGTLKWNILIRPEAFDELIAQLKTIKSLTVSVTTLAYQKTLFGPISRHAKRMIQGFRFPANTKSGDILADISELVSAPELESAKIEGKDEHGLDQTIKLENTPDSFGVFDYDRVAEMMNLSPNNFSDSPFMKELLKVAEEKKRLFR